MERSVVNHSWFVGLFIEGSCTTLLLIEWSGTRSIAASQLHLLIRHPPKVGWDCAIASLSIAMLVQMGAGEDIDARK